MANAMMVNAGQMINAFLNVMSEYSGTPWLIAPFQKKSMVTPTRGAKTAPPTLFKVFIKPSAVLFDSFGVISLIAEKAGKKALMQNPKENKQTS